MVLLMLFNAIQQWFNVRNIFLLHNWFAVVPVKDCEPLQQTRKYLIGLWRNLAFNVYQKSFCLFYRWTPIGSIQENCCNRMITVLTKTTVIPWPWHGQILRNIKKCQLWSFDHSTEVASAKRVWRIKHRGIQKLYKIILWNLFACITWLFKHNSKSTSVLCSPLHTCTYERVLA